MVITKVRVNCVSAETDFCPSIPKGAIGLKVGFSFTDTTWDNLVKTIVFRNSTQTLDSVLEKGYAVIPHELLSEVKDSVYVGVYGVDANNNLAIPTVWAKLGEVSSAANPSGDPAADPTLPYWAQIQGQVEELQKEKLGQEDLEDALAQAKESGEFDGPPGKQGEKGEKGDPGIAGKDGYTPVRGTDYWTDADKEEIAVASSQAVLRIVKESSDIVCEASGDVITLTDASNRELQGLCVFGKTIQNGTPSPDAPVELMSVGDSSSVGVTIVGKNLLDIQNPYSISPPPLGTLTTFNNGVELSINQATNSQWQAVRDWWSVPAGTYTLSAKLETDDADFTPVLGLYRRSGPADTPVAFNTFKESKSATFTFDTDGYLGLYFHLTTDTGTSGARTVRYYDIQLEEGANATTYEPYSGQYLAISTPNGLPGIPVPSSGNYTDKNGQQWICDELDFGRGEYVQRIGEAELDGTENWRTNGANSNGTLEMFYCAPSSKWALHDKTLGSDARILSECFMGGNRYTEPYKATIENNYINISMPLGLFADVNAFVAFLERSPVKIKFVLADSIETPIPEEERAAYAALHTKKPNTTVYNDAGAHMKAEYVADTKTYIDNKFAAFSVTASNTQLSPIL